MRRTLNGWALAAVLGVAGTAVGVAKLAAAPAPAEAPAVAADTATDMSRLSPEAARMYTAVRTPGPAELAWQQIPWVTDLQEGLRQARLEKRPLLLFVSGDDPLEKC